MREGSGRVREGEGGLWRQTKAKGGYGGQAMAKEGYGGRAMARAMASDGEQWWERAMEG